MFESILNNGVTLQSFLICMAVALALGFVVAVLHMKTSLSNKNFVITLTILPALVASVILMVNGNLGTSIAVVGAFSLVRFRSIPGNSKEIMNVFFAMAIGLAVGTGFIGYAAAFTLVIAFVILALNLLHFGEGKTSGKILKILIPESLDYTTVFDEIFKSDLSAYELRSSKTADMGSLYELTYLVSLKRSTNEKEFMDHIRVKNGNLKVTLSHPLIEGEL